MVSMICKVGEIAYENINFLCVMEPDAKGLPIKFTRR